MLVKGKKYKVLYDSLDYFEDGTIVSPIAGNTNIAHCVLASEYVESYTIRDYQREDIKCYPMNINELKEI